MKKTENFLVDATQDPYGNYFVQDLIEFSSKKERESITNLLTSHVIELGICKYSSLVIIKMVTCSSKVELKKLVKRLFIPEKLLANHKNKFLLALIKKVAEKMAIEDRKKVNDILEKNSKLKAVQDLLMNETEV